MDTETDTAVVEQHGVSQEQHQTGHLTMSYQRLEYLEYIFKTYFLPNCHQLRSDVYLKKYLSHLHKKRIISGRQ